MYLEMINLMMNFHSTDIYQQSNDSRFPRDKNNFQISIELTDYGSSFVLNLHLHLFAFDHHHSLTIKWNAT